MKNLILLAGLCGILNAAAQDDLVTITSGKTTSLVFPSLILHVDRGQPELLLHQVQEADNLLLLKAASPNLPETNLSVLTDDGKLYALTIRYDSNPSRMIYYLGTDTVHFRKKGLHASAIETYCTMLLDNPCRVRGLASRVSGMTFRLNGIYTRENLLFLHLVIYNNSPMDYDIGYMRFFIAQKKKARRTALQEIDISPLRIAGNRTRIVAGCSTSIVVALPMQSFTSGQYLAMEIAENKGGRLLQLRLHHHRLMKTLRLPPLTYFESKASSTE